MEANAASQGTRLERIKWMLLFFRGYRRWFFLGLGLAVVDAVAQSMVPMFFRYVLNWVERDPQHLVEHEMGRLMGLAVGLFVIFFIGAYLFHVLTSIGAARFSANMQVSLYDHVQRLSHDFFSRTQVGEITQRLNSDVETVHGAFGTVCAMVWGLAMLTSAGTMMVNVSPRLSILFFVLMIVVGILTRLQLPILKRMHRRVRDALGDMNARVTEYIGIQSLIRSFSRENLAERRVRVFTDRVRVARERLQWWQFLFFDAMQVLVNFVAPMTLLFLGSWMISGGILKVGDLVAFWGYWLMLGGMLASIVNHVSALYASSTALDRIYEFFAEVPRIKDAPDAVDVRDVRGEVVFENVSFRYPGDRGGPVLKNLTLRVAPGEHVALVGPSGAGKSTIMLLLMRFFDPEQGAIRIDGIDIRGWQQRSLRRHVGVVMQESVFFAGTILENLRLAKSNATEAEVRAALEAANAWEFVSKLDDGVHTLLGERGARLSGGQRQRLSIARVFLKNPSILLFDEATSALDSVSEKLVKEAMSRLQQGRTSLVIAHRLSTVIDADRILVMERGELRAQGTHQELLRSSDLYRELSRHQGID